MQRLQIQLLISLDRHKPHGRADELLRNSLRHQLKSFWLVSDRWVGFGRPDEPFDKNGHPRIRALPAMEWVQRESEK